MKTLLASITIFAGLMMSVAGYAQAPAAAPAGSTGSCKDGSFTSNATKKGACAGHKGVKDWYGDAAVAAPAAPMTKAAAPATAKTVAAAPSSAPATGGGPGQVWVNTSSKVYHCAGTKYYGKTKQGEYMTEAAAKAAGDHADHGKASS